MNWRRMLSRLILLGLAAGLVVRAEGSAWLQVRIVPAAEPARVEVDGKEVTGTATLSPGNHLLRVRRPGVTLERGLILKNGVNLIVIADFKAYDIRQVNQTGYQVFDGPTRIIFSPPSAAPTPTPPPTPTQTPNPAPPKPESKNRSAPLEENLQPSEPQPYCPPKPNSDACLTKYERSARGVLYAYYCLLVHHDFEKAYRLRLPGPGRDRRWFYEAARPFCGFHDFRIKNLKISTQPNGRFLAVYVVDLLDLKAKLMETWNMQTVIVNQGEYWLIFSTTGRQTFPPQAAPEESGIK